MTQVAASGYAISVSVKNKNLQQLEFRPLTPAEWEDLEALFGKRGAYGGCWCMWWRMRRRDWDRMRSRDRKQAFHEIVHSDQSAPGILAYVGDRAIGWCSVAPRETYVAMRHSRTLRAIDDQPVWSIACFYVAVGFRRQGVLTGLLHAAIQHVREQGGTIIEAYPLRPLKRSAAESFMGVTSTFLEAGFEEVAQTSPSRSIVRYYL